MVIFFFLIPKSVLVGNTLNFFPQGEFVQPMSVIVSDLAPCSISIHKFLHLIFYHCPFEEGY